MSSKSHLSPIRVRQLRTLALECAAGSQATFVSSGSGLELCSGYAYVAIDDDVHVGVLPASLTGPVRLVRVFPGELPVEHAMRKRRKPDLEAVLGMRAGHPDRGSWLLLGVPSGSTLRRRRGFVAGLHDHGEMRGVPRTVDWSSLFTVLERELPELNVEGAAVVGDRFLLLCRGTSGSNHVATLSPAAVLEDLVVGEIGSRCLQQLTRCELGELDGVALGFSDATTVDGRIMVTATAEDTDNAYDDGPVAGSVVAWLCDDCTGATPVGRVDAPDKVEGLAVARASADELVLWLVTDDDDPARPSRLIEARVARG